MLKQWMVILAGLSLALAACAPVSAPQESPAPPPAQQPQAPQGDEMPYPPPAENLQPAPGTAYPLPAAPGGETGAPPPVFSYPQPPTPTGKDTGRGTVFLDESSARVLSRQPLVIGLALEGNLPTPCHKLVYEISQPDARNRINVAVYSVFNPDEVCTQVLAPFSYTVELGSFPEGKYKIVVNDVEIGEVE
jgi:hypothetical protein